MNFQVPVKRQKLINILVYGRPGHHRNCFLEILSILSSYSKKYYHNQAIEVNLYSIETLHEDVEFSNGLVLKSLGTLSLQNYAAILMQSHVGISFMASPHPSYPPLEMACFGFEVLTNQYIGKDLSKVHPNVHSIAMHLSDDSSKILSNIIDIARKNSGGIERKVVILGSLNFDDWPVNFNCANLPLINV